MNKHTPGPWVVSEVQLKDWEVEISDGSIVTAAAMHVNDDACTPDEETMANARLIAAAPDLLDALQDTLSCLENWVEVASEEDMRDYDIAAIEKAKGAIKKATEGDQ